MEVTLPSDQLRVDRRRAQQDASAHLLLVLDTSRGEHDGAVANGPRLVDKQTGEVTRPTVPEALPRAQRMAPA